MFFKRETYCIKTSLLACVISYTNADSTDLKTSFLLIKFQNRIFLKLQYKSRHQVHYVAALCYFMVLIYSLKYFYVFF